MPNSTNPPQCRDYVIVFGAAVRASGRPSAALRRRIDAAAGWAHEHPDAMIMPTGGVGADGPAEAEVIMACLVAAGIEPRRIIMEGCGRDTLESIERCNRLLRDRGDCRRVICCTSAYHQPRCTLLLRLLGHEVVVPTMPKSREKLSRFGYVRLVMKEVAALPFDAALLLFKRSRMRASETSA